MNDHQFLKPTRRSVLFAGATLLAAPALMTGPALAITPAEIKSKGTVVIGRASCRERVLCVV